MNINSFEKCNSRITYYQILYVFLIILITILGIIGLIYFKNITKINYQGIIKNNNVLEIENLTKDDVSLILESKKIKVEDKKIKHNMIDIEEKNNSYLVKINLDKKYLDNANLEVNCILKEESLYQFILKTMKGDL